MPVTSAASMSARSWPMGLLSEKILTPLLGETCADAILTLDTTRLDCFKLLLSKGLSIGIVGGSAILKVPQIINIVASGSAEGLSFASVFIETLAIAITVAYNYRLSNPFSTYGEGVFVNMQNIIILFLILGYRGEYSAMVVRGVVCGVLSACLFSDRLVPLRLLTTLQWSTIFLVIPSKVPQIWQNYKAGSTGQLSIVTVFLQFAGTIARVFTTLQEGLDSAILFSFISAALLNAILLLQFAFYYRSTYKKLPKNATIGSKQKQHIYASTVKLD
ncbi:hypothetical protein BASA50_000730 [Batrachochytrium salamandrivorans]|uniref:Mannose-P-dolichol utilization defect 1 protein homolog n=1 Tax=Batrachochytrium salamandrivorans TaxID=1357716 RepID=A0ABQ8ETE4_9FUNG|nr:hypothetical protein BASA60_004837 [Batrachochytrium salamandrivorans]KAH6576812.1 hypothetical protein BASA62_001263 [Batrachochytrium salamandrivorans]KAH6585194.1 hypothetical protein BASA61_006987 [Batrachochytrium salamandrivorans]KAH6586266.1 hypothetical protein BASA50_000730 [Batrachochytrium salamandrivorans]KAH9254927.1 hypothetical protein BASA81_006994 [Batrachochytrium salamandrivorans]